MADYTELKRLAEAAPDGPWYQHGGIKQVVNHDRETICETFEEEGDCPTARFIAAANPAEVLALIKELESHKRMLLAAACDMGAIGEALKADMDDDGDALLGAVINLKAQNTRMLEWVKDISCTSGDKGAVMGARQLLKEFAE